MIKSPTDLGAAADTPSFDESASTRQLLENVRRGNCQQLGVGPASVPSLPEVAMPHVPLSSQILAIEDLFMGGAFSPAPVQRDYQWRTVHCRDLLDDIERTFSNSGLSPPSLASDSSHAELEAADDRIDADLTLAPAADKAGPLDHYMLGAMVVTPPVEGRCHVYDGLQRLTTLTVLMAVLRDLSKSTAVRDRLDGLIRLQNGQFRVLLPGNDPTLARQIQPRGEAIRIRRTPPTSDMGRRVRIAAQVFREALKPWAADRRDAFTDFLLRRVYVDLQTAADPRLARQIFVTTNMRGEPLDRVDLLKGQLVDIADDDDTAATVVANWNAARAIAGDQFPRLLTAVDLIERQAPQGEDHLNALAEHIATTRGAGGVGVFTQRLGHHAADLAALDAVFECPPNDAFAASLWRLQLIRWDAWRPLALLWFADYRRATQNPNAISKRKVDAAFRRFGALHRRCVAMTLAGFSSGDRERIFARAIAQASRGENPLASTGALAFSDLQIARIRESLRTPLTDKDVRLTLIRWLESSHYDGAIPAYVREATVEHILPRRPAIGSEWIAAFPDPEARYMACNAFGNLAALDKARNEGLRNADFSAKSAVLVQAAADFKTLADLTEATAWTAEAIEARTERLARHVEAQLDLPPPFTGTRRGSR